MKAIALLFASTLFFGTSAAWAGTPLPVDWGKDHKKIVAFGWDWGNATPSNLLAYADQIDKTGISGVSVYLTAHTAEGQRVRTSSVIDGAEWTDEMLASQVDTLRRATAHPGLAHSFIRTLGAPQKRINWADDAHWARVARSMGALARFAKQTNLRGFIIDPEDYHNQNQFECKTNDSPYDVLAPLARQRGRELFAPVFAAYPDIKIIGYWLWAWHTQHILSENPMQSCRQHGDLWPAFLNGILDVMPPEATLIEGNEWAYQAEAEKNEFMISATSQRNSVHGLVAPENRNKFRAQVRTGFGLYLDSYTGSETNRVGKANPYYFGPVNGSRLGHFERNLGEALDCADEYVWLWHEKYEFVKWGADKAVGWHMERATWESQLPGLSAMLRAAADSEAFFREDVARLKAAGKIVNLVTNDVAELSAQALGGRTSKDELQGKGYFHLGDEKALPGTHYLVEIEGHGEGLNPIVYWQQRKGGGWWRWRMPGHGIALTTQPDGTRNGRAIIRVPEGVDALMIQCRLQSQPNDPTGYDKIFLGRINY